MSDHRPRVIIEALGRLAPRKLVVRAVAGGATGLALSVVLPAWPGS